MSILRSFGGAEACQGRLSRPSGSQLKLVNLQIKATDLALRFVSFIRIHDLERQGTYSSTIDMLRTRQTNCDAKVRQQASTSEPNDHSLEK
jgi:hypothetical protein